MGFYQFYEFLALERPLRSDEIEALGWLSSRAEIRPSGFSVHYDYGSFRGDPESLMSRYFDLHVYVDGSAQRRLIMRLPVESVDREQLAPYLVQDAVALSLRRGHLLLDIDLPYEGALDWLDPDGMALRLAPVRELIIRGDLRPLYIAWLAASALLGEEDDDDVEPPVPPGLAALTPELEALVAFLGVDPLLVRAAAQRSSLLVSADEDGAGLASWIAGKSPDIKNTLLKQVALGEGVAVGRALMRSFVAECGDDSHGIMPGERTIVELEELAASLEAEELAQEEAARDAAHRKRTEALRGREAEFWRKVRVGVATKKAKGYDEAVAHLKSLRDLAELDGHQLSFNMKLKSLCEDNNRLTAFKRRLRDAGMY